MKRHWTLLLILACLGGCQAGTPTEAAKAGSSPPDKKEGGLKIMTDDDMKKLQAERPEMIQRSTALGEEKDPVEALRKQTTGK